MRPIATDVVILLKVATATTESTEFKKDDNSEIFRDDIGIVDEARDHVGAFPLESLSFALPDVDTVGAVTTTLSPVCHEVMRF